MPISVTPEARILALAVLLDESLLSAVQRSSCGPSAMHCPWRKGRACGCGTGKGSPRSQV